MEDYTKRNMEQLLLYVNRLTSFVALSLKGLTLVVDEFQELQKKHDEMKTTLQQTLPKLMSTLAGLKAELSDIKDVAKCVPDVTLSHCVNLCNTVLDAQDKHKQRQEQNMAKCLSEVWEKRNEGFVLAQTFKKQYIEITAELATCKETMAQLEYEKNQALQESKELRTLLQETISTALMQLSHLKHQPQELRTQISTSRELITSQTAEVARTFCRVVEKHNEEKRLIVPHNQSITCTLPRLIPSSPPFSPAQSPPPSQQRYHVGNMQISATKLNAALGKISRLKEERRTLMQLGMCWKKEYDNCYRLLQQTKAREQQTAYMRTMDSEVIIDERPFTRTRSARSYNTGTDSLVPSDPRKSIPYTSWASYRTIKTEIVKTEAVEPEIRLIALERGPERDR